MINILKQERLPKLKPNDSGIVTFRVIGINLYTLDKSGIVKQVNLNNGSSTNSLTLHQSTKLFDISGDQKWLIYNKDTKIKLLNLGRPSEKSLTVGIHNTDIKELGFSIDGRLMYSTSDKEYRVNIWHRKNLGTPLFTLSTNYIPGKVIIQQIDSGVYHAVIFNEKNINGYKLVLDDGFNYEKPIKADFHIESDNSILNIKLDKQVYNLVILYGSVYNLHSKFIKYAKNAREFKQIKSDLLATKGEEVVASSGVNQARVVNEIKPYVEDNILQATNLTGDNKVSLINVLRNSIINNDIQSLEWAINQQNESTIESTIRKMDNDLVKAFIAKSVEVLQSMRGSNIVTWIKMIFSHHRSMIVTFPQKSLENLRQLQLLIANRVKNYNSLVETKAKLDVLLNNTGKSSNKQKTYEPLLVYNESDSEDDVKMKGNVVINCRYWEEGYYSSY
jgi:hypothetical protein